MTTILAVDDSPSILKMLGDVLRANGFEVHEAGNGYGALKVLGRYTVDLVITDLLMPGMDGVELIREIRKLPECKTVPIIMLTTQSNEAMQRDGKAAGATCWIVKPFLTVGLTALIREMVDIRKPPPVSETLREGH
jgi:two-component system chemotaxis response regulator CheY